MTTTTLTTELPKELQQDPAWRAVLYLLEEAFPNEQRVWEYVDAKRWSIRFDKMLENGYWSGGERMAQFLYSPGIGCGRESCQQ